MLDFHYSSFIDFSATNDLQLTATKRKTKYMPNT